MESIGLRELRQNASEYVRRAEAGETIAITVSGREVARLAPSPRRQWVPMSQLPAEFARPLDASWDEDMALLDYDPRDPWDGTSSQP